LKRKEKSNNLRIGGSTKDFNGVVFDMLQIKHLKSNLLLDITLKNKKLILVGIMGLLS
jgi:hypothetical protein